MCVCACACVVIAVFGLRCAYVSGFAFWFMFSGLLFMRRFYVPVLFMLSLVLVLVWCDVALFVVVVCG